MQRPVEASGGEIATELERVAAEYARRETDTALVGRYSLFDEAALLHTHSLERALLSALKRHGCLPLTEKRILDVGCGGGMLLRRFIEYGAQPRNLAGVDLLPQRVRRARELHPAIDWQVASGHEIPYPDGSFDLVMSFVVFSSILSLPMRQRVADEMRRVCTPGGLLLCYDLAYSNPRNPAVEGISRRMLAQLFQREGERLTLRRVSLAPPIARLVAPRAPWLAALLDHLPPLTSHTLAAVRMPPTQRS